MKLWKKADRDRVELNGENKYFFGCWGIVGVYTTSVGRVKLDNNAEHKIVITQVESR